MLTLRALARCAYSYDAFGQRLKRTTPAEHDNVHVRSTGGDTGVIGTSEAGGVTQYLLTPSGLPVAEANPAVALSYVLDASGSMVGSITAAGMPWSSGVADDVGE